MEVTGGEPSDSTKAMLAEFERRKRVRFQLYQVVQRMAQLLIGHKFQSGLLSHMKFHTKQFQHVSSQHKVFQLNLTKNTEMTDVLKKGV